MKMLSNRNSTRIICLESKVRKITVKRQYERMVEWKFMIFLCSDQAMENYARNCSFPEWCVKDKDFVVLLINFILSFFAILDNHDWKPLGLFHRNMCFMNLNGTKAISSVIVFRPNLTPIWQDNFRLMITEIIVMKYTNHEPGVSRFFKLKSLVVSSGYREKKYSGPNIIGGEQWTTCILSFVQITPLKTPRSASSLAI